MNDHLANKALHLTVIPLRSIAAGELGRWMEKPQSLRICRKGLIQGEAHA